MTLRARRIVTGHDESGRPIVASDEVLEKPVSARLGHARLDFWKGADGTIFRFVEYRAGVAPRNHRTDSIDYAVVLSGEIDMELDDTTVHLKAGDCMVQRGTIHNWVNNGTAPCVLAVILIDAKSVEAGGKVLPAVG